MAALASSGKNIVPGVGQMEVMVEPVGAHMFVAIPLSIRYCI